MRTIALEEHFVTAGFLKATGAYGSAAPPWMQAIQSKLLDLGAGRINAMDEGGIDLQVLSLVAMGMDDLDAANETSLLHDVNDELAAAVKAHPRRLAGFASLPMKDPVAAAKELERCVQTHSFTGAMLDGTVDGVFLDAPQFLPVFEAAVALGVPIYLHPAPPPRPVQTAYFSGLPGDTGHMLSIAGWGWHAEMGLHTLRLIVSGLFDRLPELQLIIGHMGEGLPYALERSSSALGRVATHLKRSVAETFRDQVHVTTSGYFTRPPFDCALAVCGIDRLMYSVDYPFSPNTYGQKFLDAVEGSLSAVDFEKLTHANAERLLKL
jgi:predicted TIM-barrel fold metal-dependent hydrolase